jgi:hypothetical protein
MPVGQQDVVDVGEDHAVLPEGVAQRPLAGRFAGVDQHRPLTGVEQVDVVGSLEFLVFERHPLHVCGRRRAAG